MQNFSHRLAQAISASGKSKGALAAHADVALSTVSRWLGGTVPKAETLEEIAGFLGVDAKWLIAGQDPLPGRGIEILHALPPHERPLTVEERLARMEGVLERMAASLEKLADRRPEI